MVEEVTAYKGKDGQLYATRHEAEQVGLITVKRAIDSYFNYGVLPPKGKVRFTSGEHNWGDGDVYKSDVFEDPSKDTILRLFEMCIRVTGDVHHVYFEGFDSQGKDEDGVETLEFISGS